MQRRVDPIEARNDDKGRRLAAAIRKDPALVGRARATLDRWLAATPGSRALLEWRTALDFLDAEQLARFLESTTPRARRMRISMPFVGLLPSNDDDSRPA